MNNIIPLVDLSKDEWRFVANDSLSDYIFHFSYLPNEWFKKTIKHITMELMKIGRLKISTLHRYNYSLRKFFLFIEKSDYLLNDFSNVTRKIIEEFSYFLLNNYNSPATRQLSMTALKNIVEFGLYYAR